LPDFLLVEVYLRLDEDLSHDPALHLVRRRTPFDGMVYQFSIIDPSNRLTEHFCFFHVVYSQDEASLTVINFGYLRQTGV